MSSVVSEAAELFWLICRIRNVKLQITLAVWGYDRGYLASTICLAATGITITRGSLTSVDTYKTLSNQPLGHL